jgi:phosphomannomutase/phosphoglucomutase
MNPYIFREYDIRGIADKDFNEEDITHLGKAYGTYLKRKGGKRVSVGGDIRISTPKYKSALINGIISTGVDVIDIGIVPTPVSYFSMFHLPIDGGAMVTASHNPGEYNGFKLGVGKTTIYGHEIQNVKKMVEKKDFIKETGGRVTKYEIIPDYMKMVKEKIKLNRKLKVVVDAGNGCGALFAHELIKEIGCNVTELYCEPDGNFPNHHPDPVVEENLVDLIKKVKELKADCGIAYDGDADRLGVIDEKGNIIWGDKLLILFSRDVIKKRGSGTKVIFEVKCSQALVEDIKNSGGEPIMWKTGHSLIKEKMKETGAVLAGEMSGHLFFADEYFGYDDAIYSSTRLLEILARSDKPLSQLLIDVPIYFATPEIRVECKNDEEKFEVMSKANEYFKSKYQTINIDGVRILFEDGWGLVRASNTQPAIVLRFEAKTKDGLEKIKNTVTTKLKEFGNIKI